MEINSKIDRVKLYAAGATISRVAEFPVTETEVEIPGLPLALDDSTVQVRVESNSEHQPVATDVRIGLAVPPQTQTLPLPDEVEIKAAKTEVAKLEELLRLIDNEIQVLSQVEIPKRPKGDGKKAPPASSTTMRMAIAHYKKEQIRARQLEKRELNEKLRQAQEHLDDLLQKKMRASSAKEARPNELRKIAIIRLSYPENETSQPADPQRLILEYFVPGARWTPTYVCRLDTVANTATIAMRALICQRTGEDWNGVSLELSTAEPMMWCELPELPSLRLGRVQATPKKSGWRLPPVGAELLFEDYDRQKQLVPRISDTRTIAPPPPSPNVRVDRIADQLDLSEAPELDDESDYDLGDLEPLELNDGESDYDLGYMDLSELSDEASDDDLGDLDLDSLEEEKAIEIVPEKKMGGVFARMAAPSPQSSATRSTRRKERKATSLIRQQSLVQQQKTTSLILAYNLMEIGAADDRNQRGKLSIRQQQQTYVEILKRQEFEVKFNVMSVVQEAVSQAQQCLNQPLPFGGINVRQVAGSFDYAYHADGRVDVPSDGEFHSVALTAKNTKMGMYYVTVPREENSVFRIAQLRNPLKSPLLTGPIDAYLNGEYLLSTNIKTVPPKGTMNLGLGVEQSIKVARNTTYTENWCGHILVGLNEFHHEIKIDLMNNLSKAAKIEVRERIPIPAKEAKVDIIIDAVSPPWKKYHQAERDVPIQGGYHWGIKLSPGEQKTLSVKYIVKTTTDQELIGGNRREE
jgi:hypothetical protein